MITYKKKFLKSLIGEVFTIHNTHRFEYWELIIINPDSKEVIFSRIDKSKSSTTRIVHYNDFIKSKELKEFILKKKLKTLICAK